MYWLGTVCNIFWKSLDVAICMGKLKVGFWEVHLCWIVLIQHFITFGILQYGETQNSLWGSKYVELSLSNISLLCKEFMEFFNMGKLEKKSNIALIVENSWNIEIWGCIVGRYAELSLTNMIWEFIKRSSFIIGVDWGLNCFCYIWYIQNLPMPKLKRKLM